MCWWTITVLGTCNIFATFTIVCVCVCVRVCVCVCVCVCVLNGCIEVDVMCCVVQALVWRLSAAVSALL